MGKFHGPLTVCIAFPLLHNCCQAGSQHLIKTMPKVGSTKVPGLSGWRTRKVSGLGCSNVSTPNLRAGHVSQSKTSSLRTVLVLTMWDPRGWGPARRRSAESPQSKKAAPTLPQERGARWAATVGRLPKHLLPRRLRRPHGLRTPKLPARSCGPAPLNCPPARLCPGGPRKPRGSPADYLGRPDVLHHGATPAGSWPQERTIGRRGTGR